MSDEVVSLTESGEDSFPLSMDYFRARFAEFNQCLQALDESYQAGLAVYFATDPPPEGIYNLLMDYESKRSQLKATAQALNTGAAIVNTFGGNVSPINIPATLGALPALVVPAIVFAAVASVANYIAYAKGFTAGMLQQITVVKALPESASKPEIVSAMQNAYEAQKKVSDNALANLIGSAGSFFNSLSLPTILLIAGVGFYAWRKLR